MAVSGLELKLKRTAAKVKAKDVAHAMGVPPYHLSRIERYDEVDLDTVAKYLAALRTCGTVPQKAA